MATSIAVSHSADDAPKRKLRQLIHAHQSIRPLRHEKMTVNEELNQSQRFKPVCSHELTVKSSEFSGGMIDCYPVK